MHQELAPRSGPGRALLFPLVAAALVCACAGPAEKEATGTGPEAAGEIAVEAPAPWTDGFLQPGQLVADVITIEGPAGLRSHTAIVRDDDSIDYDQQVTENGLVQTMSLKPDATIPAVTVTIDNWTVHAFQRIVITERPSADGDVVLRASGQVVAEVPDGNFEGPNFQRRFRVGSAQR